MVKARSAQGLALIATPLSDTESAGGGNSSAVRIARTPGMAKAALVSRCLTLAWGKGLVSNLQMSMPSARRSSAKRAVPVSLARRSGVM